MGYSRAGWRPMVAGTLARHLPRKRLACKQTGQQSGPAWLDASYPQRCAALVCCAPPCPCHWGHLNCLPLTLTHPPTPKPLPSNPCKQAVIAITSDWKNSFRALRAGVVAAQVRCRRCHTTARASAATASTTASTAEPLCRAPAVLPPPLPCAACAVSADDAAAAGIHPSLPCSLTCSSAWTGGYAWMWSLVSTFLLFCLLCCAGCCHCLCVLPPMPAEP